MSHLNVTAFAADVSAEYVAARTLTSVAGHVYNLSASVRLTLNDDAYVHLDIEDVRYLAEVLPGLVMAHDAAEHVRAEQVAAEKSATESKAA